MRGAIRKFGWQGWLAVAVAAVLGMVLLGAGCRLGPDYERPSVEVPGQWRWKEAVPRDHEPTGRWWTLFGDPALDALVERAGADNLELKAALARVEQARATARVSKSDFYPAVQGSASYARYRTSANAPSPVGFPIPSFTMEQWETPLDLSYEIDLWGRVSRSFEAARGLAMSAEAARRAVLLALQADVVSSYLALQALDREVQLLGHTVAIRNEALDIFRQRLKAGMLTEFEVQRGQVEVASAEADLEAVRRMRAAEFNRMAVLCGRAPSVFEFQVSTQAVALPEIAAGLPADLLERRPDVAQAERVLASRMAEIGVAKAAFFPSVRLTASGGLMSGELSNLFEWDSHTWALGPRIDLPIFAGGRNRAGLERARAAYEEAVANYRQQVLVAFREVEDSLSALHFFKAEVAARRVAAEAATGAARQAFARYQAGAVNFLDVVDAEQARLLSLVAQERALREQQLATVRLMKALGGGWNESDAL
ncbi:MAG: efflux transporter outer membrane subunit [Verrucomicrobiales bacterium]|nr:efflux transporter outer membrane subunit [Verrucomicrobiales bacterium]